MPIPVEVSLVDSTSRLVPPSSGRTVPRARKPRPWSIAGTGASPPAATCSGRPPFAPRCSPERLGSMSSVRAAAPAAPSICAPSIDTRSRPAERWCSACGVHGALARRPCRSCSDCIRSHLRSHRNQERPSYVSQGEMEILVCWNTLRSRRCSPSPAAPFCFS
jgi:hypothetical protein